MDMLAARMGRVQPSATVAISTLALQLKAEGRDVIGLAAGEPDFDTPAHVREAAKRAIDAGHTRYTAPDGMPELKQAIRRKFARENGLDYDIDRITVANGGKQVLFNALLATVEAGDQVVIPAPFWVSYPDIVRLAGGEPVILPTRAEDGFRPDPQALAAAITPRTKWLILNSPGNPSGAGLDAQALAGLADVLRSAPHVHILSDDIYEHLAYPPFRFATLAAVAPDLAGRILVVNGVSKAWAMTGWRIGYGAGPGWLIRAMGKLQSQSTSNPCTVSQWAALAALDGPQDFIAETRPVFQARRDRVVAVLNEMKGLSCPLPDGAFYVYPSIAGLVGMVSAGGQVIETDQDFADALLREQGVAVVPGAAFGLSPHIRLSYAAADDVLERALQRIGEFCAGLRPAGA